MSVVRRNPSEADSIIARWWALNESWPRLISDKDLLNEYGYDSDSDASSLRENESLGLVEQYAKIMGIRFRDAESALVTAAVDYGNELSRSKSAKRAAGLRGAETRRKRLADRG